MASLATDEEDLFVMDCVSLEPLHNPTEAHPDGQPVYTICSNGHSFNHDTLVDLLLRPEIRCPICRNEIPQRQVADFVRNRDLEKQIEELKQNVEAYRVKVEKDLKSYKELNEEQSKRIGTLEEENKKLRETIRKKEEAFN